MVRWACGIITTSLIFDPRSKVPKTLQVRRVLKSKNWDDDFQLTVVTLIKAPFFELRREL